MYVVETDAPCKMCGSEHGVVTKQCKMMIWVDPVSAGLVSKLVEGSKVREIEEPPADLPYVLDITKGGFPDPLYQTTRG
jgi:hypothetical protein